MFYSVYECKIEHDVFYSFEGNPHNILYRFERLLASHLSIGEAREIVKERAKWRMENSQSEPVEYRIMEEIK